VSYQPIGSGCNDVLAPVGLQAHRAREENQCSLSAAPVRNRGSIRFRIDAEER
jgi:hypothetical protein